MTEKITRASLTLPTELLAELDSSLKAQGYSSRSEAIRDALRDFLADYRWRKGLRGRLIGVLVLVYEHDVRGLPEALVEIQHSCRGIMSTVQHLHLDAENCLETSVLEGPSEKIRKLVDRLGALRGVKQAKLVIVKQ